MGLWSAAGHSSWFIFLLIDYIVQSYGRSSGSLSQANQFTATEEYLSCDFYHWSLTYDVFILQVIITFWLHFNMLMCWLIGKDPWCWESLRAWGEEGREDEMVGWHHQLNGHESEKTLGGSEGHESLESCSPWRHKELDTT